MTMLPKFLLLVKQYQSDLFLGVCIILVGLIGFNLGKINSSSKNPNKIDDGANVYRASSAVVDKMSSQSAEKINIKPTATSKPKPPADLRVVASKKSKTKLYHFTWCPGAKQIKDANKIWFENEQAAIQTGYKLASNCTK